MKLSLFINDSITIPEHELEIKASLAGGPGGQHVNKSNTRITLRWNIAESTALNDEQKALLIQKLASQLTTEHELIIHNSETRSQLQNKRLASEHLATLIRSALTKPKKRKMTKVSKAKKEKRLKGKKQRSETKSMRKKISF